MTEDSSNKERVLPREIEEEMKQSYVDYAMSVIVGRALPDVRDGLKPVHRRILYAMNELGNTHSKPFKKCARIVGEVLGKYHPHGDTAVYDSLVRMVQPFSLRYPLVQGQGNFGSVDGDNAAAMRYTEARLMKLAEEMLEDIDKETVSFVPNFDNTLEEPTVLPSKIPNLLLNGSSGIAVGMATNIPPHNMAEICDSTIKFIDNPDISVGELAEILPGPDFPTGGMICGTQGIMSAYENGVGKIIIRAKTKTEEHKGRKRIIVTEIPYQVNKSTMIEEIADLVKDKRITGITDIKDESDRDGMRVVIELSKGMEIDVVLNQLYKHSRMQETFGIIMLALVNNEPKVLSIKQMIEYFVHHRQTIVRKRTTYDLKKAEEKLHILEGLIIALNNIDAIVQKIKKSKDAEIARRMLISDYALSEIQAKAILDMKLQKLAALEQENIRKDHKETTEIIILLKEILASEKKILDIIKKELLELKKYSDKRRTEIIAMEEDTIDIGTEDLIKEEDMVVTVSHSGYIKRLPISAYRQQRRGGKGVIGAETKEEDWIEDLYVASTHSYILFFTDKGQIHWLKVYQIPVAGRQATGKPIVNLLNIDKDEKITAMIPAKVFDGFLVLCTKKGVVKKTSFEEYNNPRKGGIRAIDLDEGDMLIDAKVTDGKKEIMLATKNGLAARFKEEDVRSVGRVSRGVRGIMLAENDEVVGMVIASGSETLLTVCENGYGKRTIIDEYRLIRRGGKGVINIKTTERNGNVVSVKTITDDHDLVLISQQGQIIRIPASGISTIGRNTQGVRLMKLDEKDKVVATAMIVHESENGNGKDALEAPELK